MGCCPFQSGSGATFLSPKRILTVCISYALPLHGPQDLVCVFRPLRFHQLNCISALSQLCISKCYLNCISATLSASRIVAFSYQPFRVIPYSCISATSSIKAVPSIRRYRTPGRLQAVSGLLVCWCCALRATALHQLLVALGVSQDHV